MILPRLGTTSLLLVHLGGGALALQALHGTWQLRFLLEVIGARLSSFPSAIPWLVLASLIAVALLAAAQVGTRVRRVSTGEPEEDAALQLRGAFYAAVSCVCFVIVFLQASDATAGSSRLRFPVVGSVSAALAYGAFALWSMCLPRLRRARPSRLFRGLDLACLYLFSVLVLAELALRAVAVLWPNPLLTTESAAPQTRRAAGRLPPGTFRLSFPVNAGGHYDDEFLKASERQAPVVVSIGDSFSYGVVPHAFHFTTVAERELPGIEIYNMGYPAIGPTDYLYLLESEALPLAPELVIVQIFIGNDVTAPPHHQSPLAWYDADRYLLLTTIRRLRTLSQAELPQLPDAAFMAISTREDLVTHYPYLADPFAETPSFGERAFLGLESGKASKLCGSDESYYPRFFETLASMVRAAGDVPLAFVLIPDEFQVEGAIWEEIEGDFGDRFLCDEPQRRTRQWLEERGLPVLDLLPFLRNVEPLEDGRRHVYHLRDTHFNARGNEVAGGKIADFVRSLLDDPPPKPSSARITEEALPVAAGKIVKSFSRVLSEGRAFRGLVRDASLLPYAKRDVARALRKLLAVAAEPSDQEFLRAGLLQLSFFQPNVGDEPAELDAPRADGTTWRPVVAAEIQAQLRR